MDPHAFARAFLNKQTHRPASSGTTTPDHITPFPIRLIHERAPRRPRSISSIVSKPLNDDFYRFWDRFLATSPNRALNTSALARRLEQTLKAASGEENGLHTQESPAASYEQAKKECQTKVQAIVAECKRLNQRYRDRQFEVELYQHDCIVPLVDDEGNTNAIQPSGVKRVKISKDIFEKPTFNAEGACGDDVMQGSLGNCWFIAALVSVAAKPGLMQRLCVARDEAVGVYGFVFFRDGIWIPEIVDDRLFIHVSDGDDLFVGKYVEERQTRSTFNNSNDITKLRESLQKGGEALYFARCRDSQDTWLPLIEKAYAKAHGDYGSLHGGWVGEGTEDLTGGVSINLAPSDIMDKARLWEQLMQVNETYLFAGGAFHYKEAGNFGKHAYAVLQAVEHKGLRLLKVRYALFLLMDPDDLSLTYTRNPWGNNKNTDNFDGPFNHKFEEWSAELVEQLKFDFKDPGVFWVTLDNFLRYFDSIQRTRLFDETWTLTQQWTSVNVAAGAVTYLDTSFHITVARPGPIVIVLAQPDVSYFQGLQGRYTYCLHFRVYDAKDPTKYLARSMHVSSGNYINTRSVSVDLDLEAGSYNVLIKISPSRVPYRTAESVIETEAPYRKQKLLQIGRNFELAHAKGKLREKEQEIRKQRKEQQKRESRARQSKMRMLRQQVKAREKKRKDRIAQEKREREKMDLLKRAGVVFAPFPNDDPPVNLTSKPAGGPVSPPPLPPPMKFTGYVGSDMDPNAELEDDDFAWDSEMDGDVYSSSSEDEKDWFADDPWNALLVLGLRVYSQASGVSIKVRDGDEAYDDFIVVTPPSTSTSDTETPTKAAETKEDETGKSDDQMENSKTQDRPEDVKIDGDAEKQPLVSSEATLVTDAASDTEEKTLRSDFDDKPAQHDASATIEKPASEGNRSHTPDEEVASASRDDQQETGSGKSISEEEAD
ncbi:cysteine proteinase [Aureobasidium pullulans]|nr:cysteine proteinase [Aureobasidium pullulans]